MGLYDVSVTDSNGVAVATYSNYIVPMVVVDGLVAWVPDTGFLYGCGIPNMPLTMYRMVPDIDVEISRALKFDPVRILQKKKQLLIPVYTSGLVLSGYILGIATSVFFSLFFEMSIPWR